ncbi:MAG TPA: hypothetical protein VG323_12975 [Thermoanaerobaculia bacterium]|nr:hypothetical protein [Thermoanaerobaculia bacterium]
MKKSVAVFSLLVLLSVPAMAAPRDDDPRGAGGVVSRVVHAIKKLVATVVPLDDGYNVVPPKP